MRFIVNSADKFTAISKLNYSLIEESFYPRKIDASKGKIIPLPIDNFFFLRYVGQDLTIDDLEECTAISAETHRKFI